LEAASASKQPDCITNRLHLVRLIFVRAAGPSLPRDIFSFPRDNDHVPAATTTSVQKFGIILDSDCVDLSTNSTEIGRIVNLTESTEFW
jgi:hypothetical protein